MTWWELRRTGRRRYELRHRPSRLGCLVYGTAVVIVSAGALNQIAPPLISQARAHLGTIALTVAAVALLVAAIRRPH